MLISKRLSNFFCSIKTLRNIKKMESLKPKHQVLDKISLNPNEKELFSLFTTFVKEESLLSTLRVAGGWVRDKLLGKECKDIDITIDNMTGEEFIKKAKEYFIKKNIQDVHGFGVTKLNPDKSKHLETATAKIKDIWVDFVNLRGETYDPNTRVPIMRLGTAEEDAYRRDLTINSLFYNLMTESVEDFTKIGLDDLKNGIIRTPLKPYTTFFDDPLRILRTFRFASRFGFRVEEEILDSLKSDEILEALRTKVSRERVGIELNLILNHESVFDCLTHYYNNRLWDIVFEVKSLMKDFEKELIQQKNKEGYFLCKLVYENREILSQYKILQENMQYKNILFYAYLTCAVLPYSEYKIQKGKQTIQLISYIIKESIKFPNKEHNMVVLLDANITLIKEIIQTTNPVLYKNKIINWIKNNGETWELSFFLCFMREKLNQGKNLNFENNFKDLYDFVYQENLQFIYKIKPFLDGGEIIKLFQLKPGPSIKIVQDNIFYWQVENQNKNKEDLIKEINENKDNFLIRRD